MTILIPAIPLLCALLFWLPLPKRPAHLINLAGAAGMLAVAGWATYQIGTVGHISRSWLGYSFYLDALSVLVLDIILMVAFMVCVYSIGYLNIEFAREHMGLKEIRRYYFLTHAFIFTMVLVVTTQNLGLMWIAIEATTLASAFLVGFYNNKESIEAAWKYIIICSVGLAFALLGIVLIYYSSITSLAETKSSFNWVYLWEHAAQLQGSIIKIAFIFILLGFGTKVGLAPTHTWLPDAHSQAPAPISALMSGVLLNSALYGIIRVLALVNRNLGSTSFTGPLLIGIGLLSMITAAIFIATQKDYKRLLAYSSIEHMGIITVGLGLFTPLALFGALYHLMNHAFTKSLLFLASGNVYLKYRTRRIPKVTGLFKVMPWTGWVFCLGLLAIAGMPLFSVFASELTIVLAAFAANQVVPGVIFVLTVVLIFAGIIAKMFGVFFGEPRKPEATPHGEFNPSGLVLLYGVLLLIIATGWGLPAPVKSIIETASAMIRGGV